MKTIAKLLILFSVINAFSQTPNDCANTIIVCGNAIVDAEVNGIGTQEIAGLGCSSQEHNSLWLELNITASGTLGFTLTPESQNITEDYDFWVFGPNVSCNNLGMAIRCSTTNPQAANQGNNLTGMNASSTDTSEGPGANGDSFVQWLDVLAGERYYIVLDRPIGNSGFDLEWTGTASLGDAPTSQVSAQSLNITKCDDLAPLDDSIVSIDLDSYTSIIKGAQTDVSVSYHSTESDAILDINPLSSPYQNTSSQEAIYVRITNTLTGCFDVSSFSITINPAAAAFNSTLVQCDHDGMPDGHTLFNLSEAIDDVTGGNANTNVKFYHTWADADNDQNEITAQQYSNSSNPETLFVRVSDNFSGCYSIAELMLEVSTTSIQNASLVACDDDGIEDGLYTFDLSNATPDILNGIPSNLVLSYYETYQEALLETNALSINYTNTVPYSQTIYVRAENINACYGIGTIELNVQILPDLILEEHVTYCENTFPETITINGGVINDSPSNYYYLWNTGDDASNIQINTPGTYTVTVTTVAGCSKERTVIVSASNIASIDEIQVLDASDNNVLTALVSGVGNYEFALDNINDPYDDNNVFENVTAGFHTIYVRDKNGCGISDELVSVVGFPKFFTPNHDGYNDTWQVKGISSHFQPNTMVYIFDRHGKLLAQIDSLSEGWNGEYKNKPLPNDDYWFKVILQDGRTYTDHFTLKR